MAAKPISAENGDEEVATNWEVYDLKDWIRGKKIETFSRAMRQSPHYDAERAVDCCCCILEHCDDSGGNDEKQEWLKVALTDTKSHGRRLLDEIFLKLMIKSRPGLSLVANIRLAQLLEVFRLVIKRQPDLLSSVNAENSRSLFHEASALGIINIIHICKDEMMLRDPTDGPKKMSAMIMTPDSEGATALKLAVDTGKLEVVDALISTFPSDDFEIEMDDALEVAVSSGQLPMAQSLLRRSTGEPTEYRNSLVNETTVRHAIQCKSADITEFFCELRPDLLRNPECTWLHDAVEANSEQLVEQILASYPQLVTHRKRRPRGSDVKQGDQEPPDDGLILAKVSKAPEAKAIKDLLLFYLLQLLPISEVRQHMEDSSWNEIHFDLTYLRNESSYLDAFLGSVRDELRAPTSSKVSSKSGGNFVSIEFENVLQYVEIPLIEKKGTGPRTEATDIIKWLRDCKGIKNIIELRVQDARQDPNREEDIESAIENLNIRELDWRRVDMSVTTIMKGAPSVERLFLYASGNRAVIDHWLGSNGIGTLKNLQKCTITLIDDEHHISKQEMEILQKRFEAHIRASASKDKEGREKDAHGRQVSVQQVGKNLHEAKLETLVSNWDPVDSEQLPPAMSESQSTLSPVAVMRLRHFLPHYTGLHGSLPKDTSESIKTKVAILDTGINASLFMGDWGQVSAGTSFCHQQLGPKEHESPWWLATDPHGSYVANIISQLDPLCDIYVAQVAVDKGHISVKAVEKAFRWAISKGVHIINCSFVLFETNEALDDLIIRASKKNITVMCSTADEGCNIHSKVWPASYSEDKYGHVFPIAACDHKGKPTGYSSDTKAAYRIQGDCIYAARPGVTLRDESSATVSGSSVATAMATGIASLVLACEAMSHVCRGESIERDETQVLKNMFGKMQNDPADKTPTLISPSEVFPHKEDSIADEASFRQWLTKFRKKLRPA